MTQLIDLLAPDDTGAVTQAAVYATPVQYMARYGAAEAFQLLADEEPLLTQQSLLDAAQVALGQGAWSGTPTAAEREAAMAAHQRLLDALVSATHFMDGYIRAVAVLPLAPDDANAPTLRDCCMALARCALADDPDNATERMDKATESWRQWLRDVSQRRVALVGSAGAPVATTRQVRSGQVASAYDWGRFGGV